jgi:hypothetical protein
VKFILVQAKGAIQAVTFGSIGAHLKSYQSPVGRDDVEVIGS